MTGLPRSSARRMMRFCRSGTSAAPISTPRSPRATITPCVSARISSSAAIASAFSILAMTYACEPRASMSVRSAWTSDAERTNDSATKSTPSSSANSRSSRSFRVSDGMGSGTPGRLTPLWEDTSPPKITTQRARPRSTLSTRSRTLPSSIKTSFPACSTCPSTAGLTGMSSPLARVLTGDDHDVVALEASAEQVARRSGASAPEGRR